MYKLVPTSNPDEDSGMTYELNPRFTSGGVWQPRWVICFSFHTERSTDSNISGLAKRGAVIPKNRMDYFIVPSLIHIV